MIRLFLRSLITLCLVVILSFEVGAFAADVPTPKGHIYIQDFANVLSTSQKEELTQYSIQLDDATTAQLGVLILPSIGDEAVDSFAVKALRAYGLGTKEKDNGALLIVTTEPNSSGNRHIFLTTGYGLEGALPDGKVGRIIDEFAMPYLQKGEPDVAIINVYKEFYNEIAAEYDWDGAIESASSNEANSRGFGIPFPIIIFFVIYILIRVMSNRGGPGGRGGGGSRRRGGPIFYPGSFGGGGGGFRGGGGGSGGGGGAGRSW